MSPGFETVLKYIGDYGALLVIGAIFLYAAIRLINIFIKYVNDKVDKSTKKHDKSLDVRTAINEKVQALLTEFFNSHAGNRMQVIEFSNSLMSVAYLPFKYMNCTYHIHKWGYDSSSSYIDHLPTSLFTDFFARMYKHDYVVLNKAAPDPSLGGSIYDLLNCGDDQYALCAVIKTQKGKSIGYVTFKKNEEVTNEDVEDILELADKLAALLGILDK